MYKNTINKSIPCYNEDNDEPSYQLRFGESDGDVSSWKMCCIYEKAKDCHHLLFALEYRCWYTVFHNQDKNDNRYCLSESKS